MRETRTHRPGLVPLSDATKRVINTITNAGGHPYIVGGAVRDAILRPGQTPKDIDIDVFGLALDDLAVALRASFPHIDEAGRAFSVLKVNVDGEDFDVSLPRRDIKTADGHRGFDIIADPNSTLHNATARRDFTLNALMFDPATQEVIDCWGGLDDLHAGVLRHTTEAFIEDPLRVMRAAQFAARFGFTVHPNTVTLCRSLADSFNELSRERIWGEWRKIVEKGDEPSRAIDVLEQTGWLAHFPELAVLREVEQDAMWHPEGDVLTHVSMAADKAAALAKDAGLSGDDRAVVVLAALLHDAGKHTHTQFRAKPDGTVKITSHGHAEAGVRPAQAFLCRIDAPKRLRDRIIPLVREHMASNSTEAPTRSAVRRLARRLSPATMPEWALVTAADKGGRGEGSTEPGTQQWLDLAADLGTMTAPVQGLLRGDHLIAAGLRPGPEFKVILAEALSAQDDGVFDDVDGALAWFQEQQAR